jgi:hypothetical protein
MVGVSYRCDYIHVEVVMAGFYRIHVRPQRPATVAMCREMSI